MIEWLLSTLSDWHSGFVVFQYLTLRVVMATVTSLVLALLIGPWMIRSLTRLKVGQSIRQDGPQSHLGKAGTPTMGGLLILVAVTISALIWGDLSNAYLWIVVLVTLAYGVIGLVDDYLKVTQGNSAGIRAITKIFWQTVFALLVAFYLIHISGTESGQFELGLLIPYMKDTMLALDFYAGSAFVLLVFLVLVGTSNAVNLTDGLDGLAIMPSVLVAGALGAFAYVTGHVVFADYLDIPYVAGVGEVAVFAGALVGAGLGFLWFNTYPAQVFMGDIGSLSIGAALGVMAILVHQEVVLMIMGGVFVMEAVSVMLQVSSYKMTGKRIFRMAPIHHHFELKDWAEPKVIVRFWIITLILVLIGLASLKIR